MTIDARVLLVDENDDLLDGLSAWIAACPGFRVAGVAHSAAEALERIDRLKPDVVLMDMSLPDANALDVTRRIASRSAAPIVILMTFHDIAAVRAEAMSAGASACLSKPAISREFVGTAGALWRERREGGTAADAARKSSRAIQKPDREIEP